MRDQGPLSPIPWPVRYFVGLIVHSKISRTLHGQGTGRYSADEISLLKKEAWSALDGIIGASQSRWVLGGETPSEVDASLFGFLVTSLVSPA
jgi:hypothetical protein